MNILLTGGAGYIGSHVAISLVEGEHKISILDNYVNSSEIVIRRLETLVGKELMHYECDIGDQAAVEKILKAEEIDIVIHLAGLKAVGESFDDPLAYYSNNVAGTISILKAMQSSKVKKIVFSSSATVYGDPVYLPLDELHPTSPMSPYGRNKLQIEQILQDLCVADSDFSALCLRYFNPVGCHPSGLIGELPNGVPNNLMPFICQVASGKLKSLNVFGGDYDTPDGSCHRDFIHVMDLATGHLKSIDWFYKNKGFDIINLGTGNSISVLEMIKAFNKSCNQNISYDIVARRVGDIPVNYADASKASKILGWHAKHTLEDMCSSSWLWEKSR